MLQTNLRLSPGNQKCFHLPTKRINNISNSMFIEPRNSQPLSDLAQKYPDNYPTSPLPLPPNNHLYTHMCCLSFPCETTVVAILPPAPSEPITETHPHTILAFRNTAHASCTWPGFSVALIIVSTISLDNFSINSIKDKQEVHVYYDSPVAVFSPTVISLHLHHHIHHSPNAADQVVALSLLVATSPAQLKYCYILSEATAPQTGTQLKRNRDPAFNPFPAQVICKINQEMQDMIFRISQVP